MRCEECEWVVVISEFGGFDMGGTVSRKRRVSQTFKDCHVLPMDRYLLQLVHAVATFGMPNRPSIGPVEVVEVIDSCGHVVKPAVAA